MSEYIEVCAYSLQDEKISIIKSYLDKGGVVAYPTDTGYALGCKIGLNKPLEKIKRIRDLDDKHHFTLVCENLNEISKYAHVNNRIYRTLKRCTPGAYTFILDATKKVASLMSQKTKKTIGIRISEHPVSIVLNKIMGEPIISTTLILPGSDNVLYDAEDVCSVLSNEVDCIIDCGYSGVGPTTVIDLSDGQSEIIREGVAPNIF
jgi:tRNA threonylcarbamoyl adenosine modification protein (Sua5/YciO/YrdC/YwlC family)